MNRLYFEWDEHDGTWKILVSAGKDEEPWDYGGIRQDSVSGEW